MARGDWTSPAAYEELGSLDAPGFAWEYLDRNPEFTQDRRRLERADRRGVLDQAEVDAFARRWGLRFRVRHQAGDGAALWTPAALPSVITLTEQPTDIADPKFILPPSALDIAKGSGDADRVIEDHGTTLRVHLHQDGGGQPAVLLPLDQLFEIRASAAVRLWRYLSGRKSGPRPGRPAESAT